MFAVWRASLVLLALLLAAGAGAVFWAQPGGLPPGDPVWLGTVAAPLAFAGAAVVCAFAPFDDPLGAPRWAGFVAGALLGVVLGGLPWFWASLLVVGPGLLALATLLVLVADRVAAGALRRGLALARAGGAPAPVGEATWSASDGAAAPGGDGGAGPGGAERGATATDPRGGTPGGGPGADPRLARARRRGRLACLLAAIAAVAVPRTWRPPAGGARPLPLDAEVAPVISAPSVRRPLLRVRRQARAVELHGVRTEVLLSLDRPRLVARLREQAFVLEPALHVEEALLDGFPRVPPLEGLRLEAAGLARAELVEGVDRAWVRAEYRATSVTPNGPVAARLLGLLPAAARPQADLVTTTLDLEVDLRTGRVAVDARTRLARPLPVRRASLAWLRLDDAPGARVWAGLSGDLELPLVEGAPGQGAEPVVHLVHDGDVARLLRARRRALGPWTTLEAGPFADWLVYEAPRDRFLLVAPDWARQASPARSRSAGAGLLENGLFAWRQGAQVHTLLDLASCRVGQGWLATALPAGVYRGRLVLRALDRGERAAEAAAQERDRLLPGEE